MTKSNEYVFSNTEEKMLFLLANKSFNKDDFVFTKESILESYIKRFKTLDESVDIILLNLEEKKFIKKINSNFILLESGKQETDTVLNKYLDFLYGTLLTDIDTSPTYKEIAIKLHGEYLGQLNMTDTEQLYKLLSLLNVGESDRILDLGCGLGLITEFLQHKTNAHFVGIDLASEALKLARNRNQYNNKLEFVHGDMSQPNFPDKSFNVIIAIDTIYFVKNLFLTLSKLKDLLHMDGTMLIFYSQYKLKDEPDFIFTPDGTELAQNLQKLDLHYKCSDFTENEKRHWILKEKLLKEKKKSFLEEDNEQLFNILLNEAVETNEKLSRTPFKRFLYEITFV